MKHQCLSIEYQTFGGIVLRSEIVLEVLLTELPIGSFVDRISNSVKSEVLSLRHIYSKKNLKYYKQTSNLKKLQTFVSCFCIFGAFYCDTIERKRPCFGFCVFGCLLVACKLGVYQNAESRNWNSFALATSRSTHFQYQPIPSRNTTYSTMSEFLNS